MSSQTEKWAAGILALISVGLLANLVFSGGSRPGAARQSGPPVAAPASSGAKASAARNGFGDLGRYDPSVHLEALNKIRDEALPELNRNPFEFPPARPVAREIPGGPSVASGPAVSAAPPAPSVPLKALGFAQKAGGKREAIVTDDDQIFVVHEGETFARRFRVLTISPTTVELEDGTTHQSIRLPISQ